MKTYRKQWFIDRIGKRVYRGQTSCQCESCKRIGKEGLIISDLMHAEYLYDVEGISQIESEDNCKIFYKDNPNTN